MVASNKNERFLEVLFTRSLVISTHDSDETCSLTHGKFEEAILTTSVVLVARFAKI